jgi:hypothetical protein
MANYVLTVITSAKADNYFHSLHETEDAAKAEQAELLKKMNDVMGAAANRFVQVGSSTVKLGDIQSTRVTPEDEAPGLGTSVGFG